MYHVECPLSLLRIFLSDKVTVQKYDISYKYTKDLEFTSVGVSLRTFVKSWEDGRILIKNHVSFTFYRL